MIDQSFGIIPINNATGTRRFLLVHQKKGHWGFPKGHAEKGETAVESALRELAEETGVTDCELVSDQPLLEHYRFINKKGQRVDKTVTFFIGRVNSDEVVVQPEEVQDFAWLTASEARDRLTYPESRELLARVLTFLDNR